MNPFSNTTDLQIHVAPERQELLSSENQAESNLFSSVQKTRLSSLFCCLCNTLPPESQSAKEQDKDDDDNGVDKERAIRYIKYTLSLLLLGYCLNLIRAGIFARETPVAEATNPIIAFGVMWILILWLGILEGGQGSLVGLQPIDGAMYQDSHAFAHQCTSMVYQGDNLNRFIVGRQFLVVLVVFCINLCCTVVDDAQLPGFDKEVVSALLESGLAAMLITVILGQLAAEVNATNCMLDFINSRAMVVTTWFCLAIETSGLLHATYLVKCFFSFFTNSTPCQESHRSNTE